ncbi:MAG TPA: hypothetical protein ENK82_06605 [Campylobacterales bacterium]|nr:hypothetical protein [Campylobacterales bacterium]HHS93000.1 hypothetical protein [Campylobacterales bacterium]
MNFDFKMRAKDLPYKTKKEVITSYIGKERKFHAELKVLLEKIYKNAYVEILDGAEEKGKDIVVRLQNSFGEYEHIAFLVKAVNKLSGSSRSKTAEIVIQLQQCFKTKAQLQDIHEEVAISKVYIINTGTITDGAKRKILQLIDEPSYKNNTSFFAIEDLTKFFETHYPEFYFNNDLHIFFKERLKKVEHYLLDEKQLISFIEPKIKRLNKTKKEMLYQQQVRPSFENISEDLFGHFESFSSFLELVTQSRGKQIILVGEAGSGKSVLLFKIILEFINNFLRGNTLQQIEKAQTLMLPVCIRAMDIKDGKLKDFEKHIETFYSTSRVNAIQTIMIDGIDEVCSEQRLKIKNWVEHYAALQENPPTVLFSSRTNFTIFDEFREYTQYELMPYETKQAISFIEKSVTKDSILVTNIEKSLLELEGQIPFYPMALRLLIEVVEKYKEIPASMTELYNRYIGIMFGEFDMSAEIDQLYEPRIKREFFSTLSYEVFFIHDRVQISYKEFLDFINLFCKRHSFITHQEKFLESIKRVSILKIDKEEVYFSHKSFLDFFIAYYFKDNKEELIEELEFDRFYTLYTSTQQWDDVVSFYFGLRTKINKHEFKRLKHNIEKLDSSFDKRLHQFYLGRIVQYGWMTQSDFKQEIIAEGMKVSLQLKEDFHLIFKRQFKMNIPSILSNIAIFNLIELCYSSSFLLNETKKLIQHIDEDESNLYFAILYILKNAQVLDRRYVNRNLRKIVPKIQNISNLQDKVLLMMLIDFFEKKGKIELDKELSENIDRLILKYKKRFPDIFQTILSVKKSSFQQLQHAF